MTTAAPASAHDTSATVDVMSTCTAWATPTPPVATTLLRLEEDGLPVTIVGTVDAQVPLRDRARVARAVLPDTWPDIEFTVTTDRRKSSAGVYVNWAGGPRTGTVHQLLAPLNAPVPDADQPRRGSRNPRGLTVSRGVPLRTWAAMHVLYQMQKQRPYVDVGSRHMSRSPYSRPLTLDHTLARDLRDAHSHSRHACRLAHSGTEHDQLNALAETLCGLAGVHADRKAVDSQGTACVRTYHHRCDCDAIALSDWIRTAGRNWLDALSATT